MIKISVIIPHLNDHLRLNECLRRLSLQTVPQASFEVIVVDNGSRSVPVELELKKTLSNLRVISESIPTSYAARNTGISQAQGDVLAFTDSDCLPVAEWLEAGTKALLEAAGEVVIGGQIKVFASNPNLVSAVELWEMQTAFQQQVYVESMHFAATANVFCRKSLFEKVGFFNSQLRSGGDREWGLRVYQQKVPLIYSAEACVWHPARSTLRELSTKMLRVARGHRDIHRLGSIGQDLNTTPTFIQSIVRQWIQIVIVWHRATIKMIRGEYQAYKLFPISLVVFFLRCLHAVRIRLESK